MARFSPVSFKQGLHFPQRMREVFHRCVTFESGDTRYEQQWKQRYEWFLKRVGIDQGGKPLCLKSPPNMPRIPQLLDLFPQAPFIHIYRSPYVVYRSVVALWNEVVPMLTLSRRSYSRPE